MGHWSNRFLPDIVSDVIAESYNVRLSNPEKGIIKFGNHGALSLRRNPDGSWVFYNFDGGEEKGDAVNFIMERKGLDVRGALQWLEANYGARAPAEERHVNGYAEHMSGIVYGDAPGPAPKPVPASPPSLTVVHDSAAPPPKKTLVGEWLYTDAEGNPTLRVRRSHYEDGSKTYSQAVPVNGKWVTPRQAKDAGHEVKNFPYRYAEWHNTPADAVIYITEGEKCADAIKTLGLYSSTNAGGASKWTDDLAAYFKGRNVVVMPDADEAGAKWRDAVVASLAPVVASLSVATIGTHREDKSLNDVEDWLREAGSVTAGELVAEIQKIMKPVPTGNAAPVGDQKFKLIPYEDIKPTLNGSWLVKTFIPRNGVGLIYGASGTYKSFIAVDLLTAIAANHSHWGEARIKNPGAIVYICAEGMGGIENRIIAARRKYNIEDGTHLPFYLVKTRPRLGVEQGDKDDLIKAIKTQVPEGTHVAAVIVDTLSQSLGGGEENGSGTQILLGALTDIATTFDCVTIAVHHVGKGDDKRARGHSSLEGNPDFQWFIEKQETLHTRITLAKMKDGESDLQFDVKLEKIELGLDEDGIPVTSLLVREIVDADATTTAPPVKLNDTEKSFMAYALRVMVDNPNAKQTVKADHDGPPLEGVSEEDVRNLWMKEQAGANGDAKDRDTASKAYRRVRKALIDKGVIRLASHGNQTFICKIRETR